MKEKREHKRIKISKIAADYQLVDFNFWAEFRSQGTNLLKDISLGGISFTACDAMPRDSLVTLNIKIGDMIKIDDLYGRVVRVRELKSKEYEIGINFSWWDKEEDKINLVRLLGNSLGYAPAG